MRLSGKKLGIIGVVLGAALGAGVAVAVQASASGGSPSPTPTPAHGNITPAAGPMKPNGQLQPTLAATNAHCGQTLTASLTLNGDLSCPSGNGLILAANNVTLNLGGHAITGGGSYPTVGVRVNGATDTVTNGAVIGFYTGVVVANKADTVSSLRVSANSGDGIIVNGVSAKLTSVAALGNTESGLLATGGSITVTSSKFLGNKYGAIIYGTANVLTSNVASGNTYYGIYDVGFGTKFTTNVANFNGGTGIQAQDGNVIDGGGNTAKGNGNAAYGHVAGEQCYLVACN
jgi:hypothetical protein